MDKRSGMRWEREGDDLEAKLRESLRPVAPPEGFAERVEARLVEQRRRQPRGTGRAAADGPGRLWLRSGVWRAVIAAMLLLVVLLGGWGVRMRRQQHAEAARAHAQFALAMQVTARSLAKVERGLERRNGKEVAQ